MKNFLDSILDILKKTVLNNYEVEKQLQSSKVIKYVEIVKALEKTHLELGKQMFEAADGHVWPLDILANATLNRSLGLLHAFTDLIKKKNFMTAAVILRLQLDNCLRLYGAWLVDDPHDFAVNVFEGKHIRRIKAKDGKLMTDRYLVSKMAEKIEPKVIGLYEDTSGYVHLSDKCMSSEHLAHKATFRNGDFPTMMRLYTNRFKVLLAA